jgi:hypothetical protein
VAPQALKLRWSVLVVVVVVDRVASAWHLVVEVVQACTWRFR